eukprot:gene1823-2047_t
MATARAAREVKWDQTKFMEALEFVKMAAPTGFGKSLIFQAIPIVADFLLGEYPMTCSILVISPLQSLMLDQVDKLKKLGVNAAAIYAEQDEEVLRDIENDVGVCNLVFTSPESMLGTSRWRKFLLSESFAQYCVGVVFDEAHCIAQWGFGSSNNSPFRKWYGQVGEIRSLLDASVKLAVFTATASKATKATILTALNMENISTYYIEKSPVKENLCFFLEYVKNDIPLEVIFGNLIHEIKMFGKKQQEQ